MIKVSHAYVVLHNLQKRVGEPIASESITNPVI